MLVVATVAAAMFAGCAPLPPPGTTTAPPAKSSAPPPKPAANGAAPTGTRYVPADSMPSTGALAVLATIPEPLPESERVPPLEGAGGGVGGETQGGVDVPVPAPTEPLGERKSVTDTTALAPGATSSGSTAPSPSRAPSTAPASPPPAAAAAPAAGARSSSAPDTCWRVQVLAPLDSREADQAREMAESLLLTPMVIEKDQGRFKVRTKDCLGRNGADQMRRRAVDSGFTQAFRISVPKK